MTEAWSSPSKPVLNRMPQQTWDKTAKGTWKRVTDLICSMECSDFTSYWCVLIFGLHHDRIKFEFRDWNFTTRPFHRYNTRAMEAEPSSWPGPPTEKEFLRLFASNKMSANFQHNTVYCHQTSKPTCKFISSLIKTFHTPVPINYGLLIQNYIAQQKCMDLDIQHLNPPPLEPPENPIGLLLLVYLSQRWVKVRIMLRKYQQSNKISTSLIC